ncbi:MAG TPA: tannase/feruloyl esterase family alpha/beta hydrolase [Gemmatimonadaceae bacterium]|nr:tannase/feruloyl esterase family alpha/beta hydrolase [Gemmatimonadaceae bacterium]
MRRLAVLALIVFFTGGAATFPAQSDGAAVPTAGTDASRCAALVNVMLPDLPDTPTRIVSARLVDVPAAGLDGGRGGAPIATRIKQYCQVNGYVAPQNKFELRLPIPADWNQRFFFTPCAGFCGGVNGEACNPSLARGYAAVTHNGGHDGRQGFDGVWAAGSPRLQEDFGWRGVHIVTIATKAITTQYYGRPIVRSYISSCSKGGQSVLRQAQQFPEDYDGYLPIAPVYDFVGRVMAGAWFAQAVNDGRGGSVLDQAAAAAVHKSVLARCGSQAGVDEGLVTDPMTCDWRPEMMACTSANAAGSDCLTPQQVAAVTRLMSPVVNSKGQVVYAYPYIAGTETEWGGWNYSPAGPVLNNLLNDQFMKFMADATPRKNVNPLGSDFDRVPATLARARSIYDATSTDLRAVKARGGKILMWHGLADGSIMASSSVGYYESVVKTMGGRQSTDDFFRLFLIPGVHHCGGGPGLTDFDALTLLENWVEKGQAPDVLIARRLANGAVERSRPVYPYPIRARYSSGNPKDASSFVPFDPARP